MSAAAGEEDSQVDDASLGDDGSVQSQSVDLFGSSEGGGSHAEGSAAPVESATRGTEEEEQQLQDFEKSLYDPSPSLAAAYGEASFWDRRYMT